MHYQAFPLPKIVRFFFHVSISSRKVIKKEAKNAVSDTASKGNLMELQIWQNQSDPFLGKSKELFHTSHHSQLSKWKHAASRCWQVWFVHAVSVSCYRRRFARWLCATVVTIWRALQPPWLQPLRCWGTLLRYDIEVRCWGTMERVYYFLLAKLIIASVLASLSLLPSID